MQAHPEAEFVQLQINYADWENPAIQSRAVYEMARKYGKYVVISDFGSRLQKGAGCLIFLSRLFYFLGSFIRK